MKTAISVPDDIFSAADALATRLGVSRSHLYATAVAEFLAKHDPDEVTARLNEVYAAEPSGLDCDVQNAQRRTVQRTPW